MKLRVRSSTFILYFIIIHRDKVKIIIFCSYAVTEKKIQPIRQFQPPLVRSSHLDLSIGFSFCTFSLIRHKHLEKQNKTKQA